MSINLRPKVQSSSIFAEVCFDLNLNLLSVPGRRKLWCSWVPSKGSEKVINLHSMVRDGRAAGGIVLRTDKGDYLDAMFCDYGDLTLQHCKWRTLADALYLCEDLNVNSAEFQMPFKDLIVGLKQDSINIMNFEVQQLALGRNFSYKLVSLKENQVAWWLAGQALACRSSKRFRSTPDARLQALISSNIL